MPKSRPRSLHAKPHQSLRAAPRTAPTRAKPAKAPAPRPAQPAAAKPFKVPTFRVDPEKYPNLPANPSLERALRIRQALDQGKPRDEAVALADAALGPRGGPGPKARPTRKPRAKRGG